MKLVEFLNSIIKDDGFLLIDADMNKHLIGKPKKENPITLKILDKTLHSKLVLLPDLYFGEAYTNGSVVIENGTLTEFLDIALRNIGRNETNSFNAAIRDTFITEVKKNGHEVDLINLFEEKEQLPFYNQNINPPPKLVLEYRKRLEKCSVMMLIGSCHNLRLNAILENWVDWVLHPKWFFSYKSLIPGNKYFKNYGYPVPGAMRGKLGIISITYGGPMISYQNFSIFDNIPFRRIKKVVFKLGGLKTKYIRFYSVLPNMEKKIFDKHMLKVKKLVRSL